MPTSTSHLRLPNTIRPAAPLRNRRPRIAPIHARALLERDRELVLREERRVERNHRREQPCLRLAGRAGARAERRERRTQLELGLPASTAAHDERGEKRDGVDWQLV